ncbi:MAG: DUF3048 domain-containing protein [Clostridiales bacterium]|nr:DUF3048 domain-containing protein [Clostridiales bacterium]
MKRFLWLILILLLIVACRGESIDEDEPNGEEITIEQATTPPRVLETKPERPPSPPEGMATSPLTGLYICEQAAARRPFAVVYSNEPRSMPQLGLSQAALVFEVLAEGTITRIVAVFQDFDAEMIGPVRSSRHYMSELAAGIGAVFVHHGGSLQGYASIRELGLYQIDGMRYDGTIIQRDAVRRRERGFEHSGFTAASRLIGHSENRNFDMAASPNLGFFGFFDEPTAPAPGNVADVVNIPFHGSNISVFRFSEDDGLYYKYIFGNPQMDGNIDEQLAVSNVLVQVTNIYHIAGDAEGRRNVRLLGEGHGYLATFGTYTRVYWEKSDAHSPTLWFCENGEPLQLNRGATWISIISGEPTFE